jgi:DNA-binding response OmpR family regulator
MPGMDGVAVVRELKKLNSRVPVIVVSGMMENDQLFTGDGLSAVELIRKPVMSDVLIGKVAEVLSKSIAGK